MGQIDSLPAPDYTLPDPMTSNGFEDASVVDLAETTVKSTGDWSKSGNSYTTSTPGGKPLVFGGSVQLPGVFFATI